MEYQKLNYFSILFVVLQLIFITHSLSIQKKKYVTNKNNPENDSNSSVVKLASGKKAGFHNYSIKGQKSNHVCTTIPCFSLEFVDSRLEHLKRKLINYYDKKSQALATSRDGGIAFPSLEGALLSLAFLTFAVFLIDLIQQLLSRLRVVNIGSTAATQGRAHHRAKRSHVTTMDTTTAVSAVISSIESPRFIHSMSF